MDKAKKLNLLGLFLLLTATIFWGSSFIVLKSTIESAPAFFVIGVRFVAAALICFIIFFKKMIKIDKKTLLNGIILGVVVGLAYLIQTWGLLYTTPSRNAFLTASYCVLCPFLGVLFFKQKVKIYNILAAVLCLVGTGFIVFSNGFGSQSQTLFGDVITMFCAIFYSLQILFIDKYQKEQSNPIHLLTIQFAVVGFMLLISSAIFELPKMGISAYNLNGEQWLKILYLMVFCTLYAQGAQLFGQRFTSSNQSAIILSLESVFGTLFSVFLGNEKLNAFLIIGFCVVFIAVMVSELKLDPIKLFTSKKEKS